ncbi:VWA domain-containing protein [Pseudonocardia lacus]|uniref:VWA domain-containing protein n=1 Tax=Pseudonocardia lacus TaxID=2835865 RepID=UPI001BDC7CF4|nr:VWA domain-containing protein [Pseudonocardia lacus]
MGFQWPLVLLGLLAVPALAGAYVWQLRRRRRRAVRYSSVALIRAAAPRRAAWKRHAPFALLLAALAVLGTAAARPQISADVPVSRSAIILALDVSGSMCSTDVEPNRLSAAQAAVREFVRAQDSETSIGLVLFSGFAQVAVAPTTDREPLTRAIDALTTGRGTTIGAAILKSVDAIAEINAAVEPVGATAALGNDDRDEAPPSSRPPLRQEGEFAPEIVVLLTDGANTSGIEPVEAARMAGDRGVRVYPIGFGTRDPAAMVCTPSQAAGQGPAGWGAGGGAGGRSFLVADEPTLREVAEVTGGEYFAADDADRLQAVLRDLPRTIATQQRDVEISVGLVGLAILLVGAGVWTAARWTAFPS